MCAETRKHGSGRGLRKPAAATRKGGAFLLYYIGNGKLIGHGSGKGPTVKDMAAYCASRAKAGTGYIKALRLLSMEETIAPAASVPEGGATVTSPEPITYPANPLKHPVQPDVRVTGGLVNLRTGPGTAYPPVAVVKRGELLTKVSSKGWRMVEYQGKLLFISETLSEEVSINS